MATDEISKDKAEMPEKMDKDSKSPMKEESTSTPSKSYGGKSSMMKWLLIYVVIGLVVYGAWYYFAQSKSSTSGTTSTSVYP